MDDQEKPLRFYTDVLGFVKKADVSEGGYRWLMMASSEEPQDAVLKLAPNDDPAAKPTSRRCFARASALPTARTHGATTTALPAWE